MVEKVVISLFLGIFVKIYMVGVDIITCLLVNVERCIFLRLRELRDLEDWSTQSEQASLCARYFTWFF